MDVHAILCDILSIKPFCLKLYSVIKAGDVLGKSITVENSVWVGYRVRKAIFDMGLKL